MEHQFYINKRVRDSAAMTLEKVFESLGSSERGLSASEAEKSRSVYGRNEIITDHRDSVLWRLRKSFVNPFSVVLLILAVISFFTDILLPDNFRSDFTTVVIILTMLLVSGIVRFVQEMKSKNVADHLIQLINTEVRVLREDSWQTLHTEDIVPGDIVYLRAGDRVPGDMRLMRASECFVSQSVITGESHILEKNSDIPAKPPECFNEYNNILFAGSSVIGGNCTGVIVATGDDTVYGKTSLPGRDSKNGFDKGANSIAAVLIKFMIVLVPVVFIAAGLTKGNWLSAFIFALSVAVGITPELLPMVINACLAKGSFNMGRKDTIVKNINAMQGFGSIDILCTDKTGTLTKDRLVLEYYVDIFGYESPEVLDHSFLNSYYHTGITNPLDLAVRKVLDMPGRGKHFLGLTDEFRKIDEIPFDYSRKAVSVLVEKNQCEKTEEKERLIIMKGEIFSVLKHCTHVKYGDKDYEITEESSASVHAVVDEMLEDGMKVLAVASKKFTKDTLEEADEEGLVLEGYMVFFDSPKESAASAIKKLENLSVKSKVLTGDNASVTKSICRRIGMNVNSLMTGEELRKLSDNEIQVAVEETEIFAELTPGQKAEIIEILQSNGHSVGFLGDGMNDLPAMVQADVGISVDTAAEAVKTAADVILLKKDLNVLEEGILEGRKAFVNMSKYIRITASSNFGNILAIVAASLMLPFFPMTSVQLLMLNLLYDILCLILPWDNVDPELYRKPLEWSGRNLSRFMIYFGPVSSVFDMLTFGFLMFYMCPHMCGGSFASLGYMEKGMFVSMFQTGWFLESMWTQVLILHLLRTKRLPFLQSRPSEPVILVTVAGIILFTGLAMSGVGGILGMTPLPFIYFVFLFFIVSAYLMAVTLVKKIYVKRFGSHI